MAIDSFDDEDMAPKGLSQEEIDAILGYDANADRSGGQKSGVKAILNSNMVFYEKLPMLEVVFDRLIRQMSTSLRNYVQDNVEVSLESIDSMRFGEYIDALTLPTLINVFKAEEWDNYGLMSLDSPLIYSMVDVLLGGRHGSTATRIEGRPYTTIELNIIREIVQLILNDLSVAFDPVTSVGFSFDRLETNPRFVQITRDSNAIVVAHLRIDMENRGGMVDLVLPYTTLEPVRELLLQMFMGERFGRDMVWENHLMSRLWDTDVEVKVVLKETKALLNEVQNWKKGSFFPLDISPKDRVAVYCGDVALFDGVMGRKDQNVVIKVQGKAENHG